MTRVRIALLALGVAGATPAFAQQASTKPEPPPAPAPAVNRKQPAGSTIRCKDGSWAPAGAAATACDTHNGLAYRLPVITPPPPPKTRPDAGITKVPTVGINIGGHTTSSGGGARSQRWINQTATASCSAAPPFHSRCAGMGAYG